MKKVIYMLNTLIVLGVILYFNQDRMALEVLKLQEETTKTKYSFSNDNHLIKIVNSNSEIEFSLNEDNRRDAKYLNKKLIEKYLWQGDEKLYIVTDDKDNVLREYFYKTQQDNLPYGMKANNQTYYFIYNKMRSLRVVLDSKNQVVKTLEYDKNGKVKKDTKPALQVDFSYASGIVDVSSGLLFFNEGVYDPNLGEWISKVGNDDIIDNLKQLTKLPKNDVYLCSDTLDTYYHSYLCTNGNCSGLYAIDYLNYFNGRGMMVDNSKYFHPKRCNKISIENQLFSLDQFSGCVEKKMHSKKIKKFDALTHNCHHEMDEIIQSCKKISQRKDS